MMWNRENVDKIRHKLKDWEDPACPKAPLSQLQINALRQLETLESNQYSGIEDVENILDTAKKPGCVSEFLDLCNTLENDVVGESSRAHECLVSQFEDWLAETDGVLSAVDRSLVSLNTLKEQHAFVSESTGALHAACRALAAQESTLSELSEQISSRLGPLTGLEALTERLCNPSLSLAGGSFYLALTRLDQSLQYIEKHPEYKDAAQFRAQAHFALSRAVTAMLDAVRSSFEHASQQVLSIPQQADLSGGAGLALCVGRFQASATRARQVLKQVEARLQVSSEYEQLLSNCRDLYIQQRRILLTASVATAMQELAARHRGDHCTLLRAACTFCFHVCKDEYHLYYHFFAHPSDQLTDYLDGLCACLYDILRPIIIHVNHLETLAELCTILRFEWLEEQIASHAEACESVRRTVHALLQDMQERLVFRTHVHLQTDVLNYNPSPGDLAYPEKLLMMESIAASVQEENQAAAAIRRTSVASRASVVESDVSHSTNRTQVSPADLHGMWYPPVRRVLATLSRLYRCVDKGIFQGLSQEALASCVRNVARAAALIATRSGQVNGSLFEMKHLLILREQVAPFNVDFSVQETSLDFTRMKPALYTLFQKRSHLFSLSNNSLLEFLLEGTPTVKQETVDSRKEVDKQLKSVCETFINQCTILLTPNISLILDKAQMHSTDSGLLKQQTWCSADQIAGAVSSSQREIKSKLPQLLKSMQLYLACRDTELLLYRHIKMRVLAVFHSLDQMVSGAGFSEEERTVMALPTPEQVQLLLSTTSQPTLA